VKPPEFPGPPAPGSTEEKEESGVRRKLLGAARTPSRLRAVLKVLAVFPLYACVVVAALMLIICGTLLFFRGLDLYFAHVVVPFARWLWS
jgi:hypothetical protein